jgi:hypothetical protein
MGTLDDRDTFEEGKILIACRVLSYVKVVAGNSSDGYS